MWRRAWIREKVGAKGMLYAVRWYDDKGRMRTMSCGSSKRVAQGLRRKIESELNAGLLGTVEEVRLGRFAKEHLELINGQVQESTAMDHGIALRHFMAHAGDVKLSAVSARVIDGYVAARRAKVREATVNKEVRTLRGIFARGVRLGHLRENPFACVKRLREPERTIRVLTADEATMLLAACKSDAWRTFVFLALTTGCRRGEMAALRWEDVDFDSATLAIRCTEHHRTKSSKNRVVSLVPAAAAMLHELRTDAACEWVFEYKDGEPWGDWKFREFRSIVKDAKIKACTLHDLRKTFCSHLAMLGVSEAVVQEIAGHSSMETTRKHYQRILPDAMKAAPARLPWANFKIVSNSYRVASGTERQEIA